MKVPFNTLSDSASQNVKQIVRLALMPIDEFMDHIHDDSLYVLMRHLYIQTEGRFTSELNKLISKIRPVPFNNALQSSQVIGESSSQLICTLRENGGYLTTQTNLKESSLQQARYMLDHFSTSEENSARRYISDWKSIKKLSIVQELIHDLKIKYIVDEYLNCNSILNLITLWKSQHVNRSSHNLSGDAMKFHFDCDHNRFIKIFVYLDDVDEKCGPHTYIKYTSSPYRSSLPPQLNCDGRLSSREVINHGLIPEYIIGRAGTLIFADTHNLHKGTPVRTGHSRYILQLQFVDSLFGSLLSHSRDEIMQMNSHYQLNLD